ADDVDELADRLSSIAFADRLAGAIDQRPGSAAAGHALLQKERWTMGLEFLLDSLDLHEITRVTSFLQRRSLADGVYSDVAERWRLRRSVPGAEGTYVALAGWLTPILDPNAPVNELHFETIGALARGGPIALEQ